MAVLMPEAKAPCKDCPDTCEKYAEFKKKRDKFRTELQKKVNEEKAAQAYVVDAVYRVQRNQKMMKEGR